MKTFKKILRAQLGIDIGGVCGVIFFGMLHSSLKIGTQHGMVLILIGNFIYLCNFLIDKFFVDDEK